MEYIIKFYADNLHANHALALEAICWISEEPMTTADIEVLELWDIKSGQKVSLSSLDSDDRQNLNDAINRHFTNIYNTWCALETGEEEHGHD